MRLAFIILLLLIITGCGRFEKSAITTAQGYAVALQKGNFSQIYDYSVSELQSKRTKEEFVKFANAVQAEFSILYEKTIFDEKEAYVFYQFFGNDSVPTPLHMVYENGSWKLECLSDFFIKECAVESCDDNDICTVDMCDSGTEYVCAHKPIDNCCYTEEECPDNKPYCHKNRCIAEECFDDDDCDGYCINHTCEECKTHADCKGKTPFCYEYSCVGCIKDVDCINIDEDKPICGKDHVCVMCQKDRDCYDTYVERHDGDKAWDTPICKDNECVQCEFNSDCNADFPYCTFGKCSKVYEGKYEYVQSFIHNEPKTIEFDGVPYRFEILDFTEDKIKLKIGSLTQWLDEDTEIGYSFGERMILVYADYLDIDDDFAKARLYIGDVVGKTDISYCGDGECTKNERSYSAEDDYSLCTADCKVLYDTLEEWETKTYTFLGKKYEVTLNFGVHNVTINDNDYELKYKEPVHVEDDIYLFKDKTERVNDILTVTFVLFNKDD